MVNQAQYVGRDKYTEQVSVMERAGQGLWGQRKGGA